MLDDYHTLYLNDTLLSNIIIYHAFFGHDDFNRDKLWNYQEQFQRLSGRWLDDAYFSNNFGGRYFSFHDAEVIGEIREEIQIIDDLNLREKDILLASLLYSTDRIANTVGHYDSYIQKKNIPDRFQFYLIHPLDIKDKHIVIQHQDANQLASQITSDVTFLDPPYNSRQYSRFYHVLEVLAKWDKPRLHGVARKPRAENMSDYCKNSALQVFNDLVHALHTNYIVVTYNNTYTDAKSRSSRNKITYEQILGSLNQVGNTHVFEHPSPYFNTGKTNFKHHQELLFITEVTK